MRTLIPAAAAGLILALSLSGCCTSITCNAKRAAADALAGCDQALSIRNITAEVDPAYDGEERFLEVSGCGETVQVSCAPTNLAPPPEKKYREDVIVPQSRLDLEWRCRTADELAEKSAD